jgi:hypothetical protein
MMKAFEGAFSLMDSSLSFGIIVNIILAVVIRAPMKLMWNMLSTLQLLTYMTLLGMSLPTNMVFCLNLIKQVSCLNLIPPEYIDLLLVKLHLVADPANTLPEDDSSKYTRNLS